MAKKKKVYICLYALEYAIYIDGGINFLKIGDRALVRTVWT